MQVRRLILASSGTYSDQYHRAYETNVDHRGVQNLVDRTAGGKTITREAVAGIAGQIIRPSAQAQDQVQIVGGWGHRRCRFIMEVDVGIGNGMTRRQIMIGYTDFDGISQQGHVAPDMCFFVNNTIILREFVQDTAHGRMRGVGLAEANHILMDDKVVHGALNKMQFDPNQRAASIAPEDVFANLSSRQFASGHAAENLDYRSTFMMGQRKTRYSNSNPTSWLADSLDSWKMARNNADIECDSMDGLYDKARGSVAENPITNDAFLDRLNLETGFFESGYFTYSQLCSICPETDHVAEVIGYTPAEMACLHVAGQSEHWQGSTMETSMAVRIAQIVPDLLIECLLSGVDLFITNNTIGGQFDIRVPNPRPFSISDMPNYMTDQNAQNFANRIQIELMRDLTMNNQITINLQVSANVIGDTFIKIQVDGNPEVIYRAPTFCDALLTPVLTDDYSRLDVVAHDIGTLADTVMDYHDSLNNRVLATPQGGAPFTPPAQSGPTGGIGF